MSSVKVLETQCFKCIKIMGVPDKLEYMHIIVAFPSKKSLYLTKINDAANLHRLKSGGSRLFFCHTGY